MNPITKVVLLPIKAMKQMLKAMKAMMAAIMRMLGLGGLAPAHSASTPTPSDALSKEEIKAEKGNEPSLEHAKRFVPDNILESVIAFAKATPEERKSLDTSKLPPTMNAWLATLTGDKLKALSAMDRDQARLQTYKGMREMKLRQSNLTRPNKALINAEPSLVESSAAEGKALKLSKDEMLAERIRKRKRKAPSSPSLAFGM